MKEDDRPALNADWHRANPMPKNPTLDQRVAWHLAHSAACRCRPRPATVIAELDRREAARSRRPEGD